MDWIYIYLNLLKNKKTINLFLATPYQNSTDTIRGQQTFLSKGQTNILGSVGSISQISVIRTQFGSCGTKPANNSTQVKEHDDSPTQLYLQGGSWARPDLRELILCLQIHSFTLLIHQDGESTKLSSIKLYQLCCQRKHNLKYFLICSLSFFVTLMSNTMPG